MAISSIDQAWKRLFQLNHLHRNRFRAILGNATGSLISNFEEVKLPVLQESTLIISGGAPSAIANYTSPDQLTTNDIALFTQYSGYLAKIKAKVNFEYSTYTASFSAEDDLGGWASEAYSALNDFIVWIKDAVDYIIEHYE